MHWEDFKNIQVVLTYQWWLGPLLRLTIAVLAIPVAVVRWILQSFSVPSSHDCYLQPLAGFSIEFVCQKLEVRITNSDHVTVGQCNSCNCEPVTDCPNHNHMTMGMPWWLQLKGPIISILVQHHWDFEQSLNKWLLNEDCLVYKILNIELQVVDF